MSRRSRGRAGLLVIGLAAAVWPLPAVAASQVVWVAPDGAGLSCTQGAPCSLDVGLDQVGDFAPDMTSDIVVRVAGGTYRREAPVVLGPEHSGTGGHRVRIEAAGDQPVILSGGTVLTSWAASAEIPGAWEAPLPHESVSNQLFVGGDRATMASGDAETVLGPMDITGDGYEVSRDTLGSWEHPEGAELVFPGGGQDPDGPDSLAPWSWSMCPIASVQDRRVVVSPDCWSNARTGFTSPDGEDLSFITKPTTIRNHRALLDEPGEYVVDERTSTLTYLPRDGERMSTIEAVMPRSSPVVEVHDVSALTIEGIHVEHGGWAPTDDLGVVGIQANVVAAAPGFNPADRSTLDVISSAVEVVGGRDVQLLDVEVRHCGGGGISVSGDGADHLVRGALVEDVSSNGITISEGLGLDEADGYVRGAVAEESLVRDIGQEYLSAVGIMGGWVSGLRVQDNTVQRTPHIGIGVGWGWMNDSEMGDNHVERNLVDQVMQSELGDGGGIYLLGKQGSETMSTLVDNHIVGVPRGYGAIYLDSGASHWLVTGNVVEDVGSVGWLYLQNIAHHGLAWSNLVAGNYADTTVQHVAPLGTHESNLVTDNELGLTSWPDGARQRLESAGSASR